METKTVEVKICKQRNMWHKNINKRSSTQAGTLGIPTGPWSMRCWRLTGPSSRCGTDTTTMTTPCTTTSHNLHQCFRENQSCTYLVLLKIFLRRRTKTKCVGAAPREAVLCVVIVYSSQFQSETWAVNIECFWSQEQNEQNPLRWQKNSVQFFLWLLHVTKPEVKERCTCTVW